MTQRSAVPDRYKSSEPPATPAQVNYVLDLLAKREVPAKGELSGEDRIKAAHALIDDNKLTKAQASKTIEWLLTLPLLPREGGKRRGFSANAVNVVIVPAGRYAIQREGTLKFYKVDTPREGEYKGCSFVEAQASDEFHSVKGKSALEILKAIALNPQAAAEKYGQELGKCGRCGRTLTDETSRAIGIGPICREMEW